MNPAVVSSPSSMYSAPMRSIQSTETASTVTLPSVVSSVNPPVVSTMPVAVDSANRSTGTGSDANSVSFPTESQLQQSMNVPVSQSVPSTGAPAPGTMPGNMYPTPLQQPSEVSSVSYCSYSQPSTPGFTPQQPEYIPQPQYVQQQPQYVSPQPQYMPPQQQQYMPMQPQYVPPQQQYMMPQPQFVPSGYMPQQPSYPTQQHLQPRVACTTCHMMLYPPAGAELFRCPCGQVLRNPYYQQPSTASKSNKNYMTEEELKRKRRNQDLTDAGIGIGVALVGAAAITSLFAHH